METQFFNPKWELIIDVIKNEGYDAVMQELSELSKYINEKRLELDQVPNAYSSEVSAMLQKMKNLPIGTRVYYNCHDHKPWTFGEEFIKVKDGETRILLQREGKLYSCPYDCLQTTAPDLEDIIINDIIINEYLSEPEQNN